MAGLTVGDWSRRLRLALAALVALGWLVVLPPAVAGAASCAVTSAADSGPGTLRARLADPGCDPITFDLAAMGTGTITLASTLGTLARPVAIRGPGRDALVIQGNQTFPLLWIHAPGQAVALSGLTLRAGRASWYGGNLRSQAVGTLGLTDVALLDGRAEANQGGAGAYFGGGTVALTRVLVSGNEAPGTLNYGTGAGLYFDEAYDGLVATIADSAISGNTATDHAGGGIALQRNAWVAGRSASLTLLNTTVGTIASPNQTVNGRGGGIYANSAMLTLINSAVSGNVSGGASFVGQGGGLSLVTSATTLIDSSITDNIASSFGGGIDIDDGTATVTGSTISGNRAILAGGGIEYYLGNLTLTNSTLSGNWSDESGGGLAVSSGTATLAFVTVTGNTADDDADGTGIGGGLSLGGTLNVLGSIVAGNTDRGGQPPDCAAFGAWAISSYGGNLVVGGGGCPAGGTDLALPTDTGLATILDPALRANGGPTRTHKLAVDSPARDLAGTICPAGGTDQRGAPFTRPQGPGCDAGAYESRYHTLTTGVIGSGTVSRAPVGTGSGPFNYPDGTAITLTANPSPGSSFTGWTVDGNPAGSTNPLQVTLTADRNVVATFALPAPSPSPSPTAQLTVTTSGAGSVARGPAGTGAGPYAYALGTIVALTPQPGPGQTFVGWMVDGANRGWAVPLTITMNADHAVQAAFAPTASFPDVGGGRADHAAIVALATRGTIRGYQDGRYGPDDRVSRSQMAALIARATPLGPDTPTTLLIPPACLVAGTWDCEVWNTGFTDQEGTDHNLWRNAATLAHYQVARGYTADDCAALGRVAPCYGPHDEVTYAQTIAFITRAMVAKGYWVAQPGAPLPYASVPAAHAADVRTFHVYTAGLGGVPAPPADWNTTATRGWFALALWAALDSYWGTDGPLPDGRAAGGMVP